MVGEDDGFTGEARLTPGFTVGYLAQEPQLDLWVPETHPSRSGDPVLMNQTAQTVCSSQGQLWIPVRTMVGVVGNRPKMFGQQAGQRLRSFWSSGDQSAGRPVWFENSTDQRHQL